MAYKYKVTVQFKGLSSRSSLRAAQVLLREITEYPGNTWWCDVESSCGKVVKVCAEARTIPPQQVGLVERPPRVLENGRVIPAAAPAMPQRAQPAGAGVPPRPLRFADVVEHRYRPAPPPMEPELRPIPMPNYIAGPMPQRRPRLEDVVQPPDAGYVPMVPGRMMQVDDPGAGVIQWYRIAGDGALIPRDAPVHEPIVGPERVVHLDVEARNMNWVNIERFDPVDDLRRTNRLVEELLYGIAPRRGDR